MVMQQQQVNQSEEILQENKYSKEYLSKFFGSLKNLYWSVY